MNGTQPPNNQGGSRRKFGEYEIIEKIGEGSSGKVYRALDPTADREVALKILRSVDGFSEEVSARFLREARALARLNHSNIVRIHHVIHEPSSLGLCMELLTGETLEQLLDTRDVFPPEEVVTIGAAVASAVGAAHQAGFIHRDIKAQNVMYTGSGDSRRVVLMDFGITRPMETSERITATGVLIGTPIAMAPEQLTFQAIDGRTDIFAIGCLLYLLLTGEYPFAAESFEGMRAKVLAGDFPPISQLRPETPPELAAIVHKAMASRPEDRFQSARDLEDALREQVEGRAPGGGREARKVSGAMVIAIGLLGAILMALVVLIVLLALR